MDFQARPLSEDAMSEEGEWGPMDPSPQRCSCFQNVERSPGKRRTPRGLYASSGE